MTQSGQLRTVGFNALLAISGEPLTYSVGGSVKAVVNRDIVRGKDFFRQFANQAADFSLAALTEVEILKTGISGQPLAGQSFVDSASFRHRIRLVTNTDVTWKCFCTAAHT